MSDSASVAGVFRFRCYERPGGPLLWESEIRNRLTNQGLAYLANVGFNQASQVYAGPFHVGLISNVPTPSLSYLTDTFGSGGHPGWVEFTGYSGGNRPTWTPGAAATIGAPNLANSAAMSVNITASGAVYGGFVVNVASLATTFSPTAILFAEGAFGDGVKPAGIGNLLEYNYSLTFESSA